MFLFGGERPPNKKPSFISNHAYFAGPFAMKRNFESIPEGREFMIRSSSPACVVGAASAWRRPDRITRCARATARRVRKFLSVLCGSAVNLDLGEALSNPKDQ